MAFCARFNDAPRFYTYAEAARWEAAVTPIRGRPDCKPLGARHKTHATIRREGEAVTCRFYNTDVLTYHPDGRIVVNLGGWATQSTCAFITQVAGIHAWIQYNRVWVSAGGHYPLHAQGENTLRLDGGGVTLDNPMRVTQHKINRAGANTVRRIYKPFKDYLTGVMKVRDEGFSKQEMGDTFGWKTENAPQLPPMIRISGRYKVNGAPIDGVLALATPTEDAEQTHANFYKASLWLTMSAASGWGYTYRPTLEGMLKLLDDCILFKHRDQCFVEIEAPQGETARDAYAKFF